MKHTTLNYLNKSSVAGFAMVVLVLLSNVSNAQKRSGSNQKFYGPLKYFVAADVGMGTTNFMLRSDIEDLKDLKFYAQGWNAGVLLGNDAVKVRMGFGQYKFEKSMSSHINQDLLSANVNLSPIQLFKKVKYFRAYLITGADYSLFSFDGVKVPKYIDPNPPQQKACCCETDLGPPADPGAPTDPEAGEQTLGESSRQTVNAKSLSLKKAQINAGLGAEFSMAQKGRYYRMFAEAHYGIPMKEIINDLSLNKTKVSSQLVINVGISFGIGFR